MLRLCSQASMMVGPVQGRTCHHHSSSVAFLMSFDYIATKMFWDQFSHLELSICFFLLVTPLLISYDTLNYYEFLIIAFYFAFKKKKKKKNGPLVPCCTLR
jgi:hypothetical protein